MSMNLAIVGCGGMGLRHALGYIELLDKSESFKLVSVCDPYYDSAKHVADIVYKSTSDRPRIYTDFSEMLDQENLDAIDITTNTLSHHSIAISAMKRGIHVMTEKPMAVTLKACRKMKEVSEKNNVVLSIAEQYRRDPMCRFTKALLDSGIIGDPSFAVKLSVGGGIELPHNTVWRSKKNSAGSMIIDQGVHESDMIQYLLGDIQTIYSETKIVHTNRYLGKITPILAKFYEHRSDEYPKDKNFIQADQEDTAFAVLKMKSGVIVNFVTSYASIGISNGVNTIQGTKGSMAFVYGRNGNPPKIYIIGKEEPLSEEEMLSAVPDWKLDELTARFWGSNRMGHYDMPFDVADKKLIAIELEELARSITGIEKHEVGPDIGMKALALPYAIFESGLTSNAIEMSEVINGNISKYQDEIDSNLGI